MGTKGKAVICREWNKPVVVEEVVFDAPGPNQVLVKIEACGVCHSDLSATNGTMPLPPPLVLGHEGCGSIVQAGPGVSDYAVGDKIVASWIPSCGVCDFCQQGKAVMCVDWGKAFFGPKDGTHPVKDPKGNALNLFSGVGVMAEYAVLHRDSLIRIPKDVASDKAALVGCGVMTGVGAAFNRAHVRPGSSCLVIGAGGVGLNVIQGCAIAGAEKVIAVDLGDNKLEFATQFGATHTINPARDGDPVAKAKELTGGLGVDYAFEVIGLGATIAQAYNAVRKGGMAVVIGVSRMQETVTLPTAMMPFDEKVLTGSVYGSGQPKLDIPRLIQLYRKGSLKLDELVTQTYSIEDAPRAFEDLEKGVNARGVIVF
jgi:S-(hydroxymethyl)glutathione dehydrogenase/alcohol dehydrogenase